MQAHAPPQLFHQHELGPAAPTGVGRQRATHWHPPTAPAGFSETGAATAAVSSAEGQSHPPPLAVHVHAGPHAQGPPGTRLAGAAATAVSSAEGQSQPPPFAVQVHAGPHAQGPPTTFFEAAAATPSSAEGQSQPPPFAVQVHAGPHAQGPPTTFLAATTGSSAAEGQSQPPPFAVQVHAGPQAQGPPSVVSFTPTAAAPEEQVQGPPLAVHAHWGPHLGSAYETVEWLAERLVDARIRHVRAGRSAAVHAQARSSELLRLLFEAGVVTRSRARWWRVGSRQGRHSLAVAVDGGGHVLVVLVNAEKLREGRPLFVDGGISDEDEGGAEEAKGARMRTRRSQVSFVRV